MKKIILLSLVAITANFAFAQYKPADQGSSVQFKIRNLGFAVTGSFSGLDGNILFDPNNLSSCNIDVSIDANTVNTDNNMRDGHLRNDSYFDVKNYPRIHFISTKITPSNKNGTFFIFGKLTIKNQTKDISFPFTATPSNEGYLFQGSFKINRKDYGVGGSSTISDELEVTLNIVSKKI
ncbi:MAG TPA: YceI family protein [Puia sp.]|nr:YceI family protein [Puia sp.]